MQAKLRDIAALIGALLDGDPDATVDNIAGIETAQPGDLAFVANPKYARFIQTTRATAIICTPDTNAPGKNLLKVDNPYLAFAKIMTFLYPRRAESGTIDPRAVVGSNVTFGKNVTVYPSVYIADGCVLEDNVTVYPGCYLGEQVFVGADTLIYPNVTIREGCRIGKRVIIHAGAVIGSDGFGFAKNGSRYYKIPQVGIVQIDDDVEIGANVTIDRAAMGTTWIKRGTKIDNLVQIAHNVVIGEDCAIVAQVGISGSTKVGNRVTLAGQVGLVGHITIGDDVTVGAQGGVAADIPAGTVMSGSPAIPHRLWLKASQTFQKLPDMRKKLRELEDRIAKLERYMEDGNRKE
ncbi:MAG: UDP-3-O-(3-hydroxymyristoyl)glucosamine N-acyltransferase [Desulfobacterota bacterium]|nr:UDP-3-O-(3-hydroxymyristoyl)glucosamine N-acyltransferase [Thermodesulfobacteriota bacterium]